MSAALTAQDKKWRAEDDARTLATAEEIKVDSNRLKLATDAAKRMAEEDRKRAIAMQKIAAQKGSIPAKKPAQRKRSKPSGSTTSKNNVFQRL